MLTRDFAAEETDEGFNVTYSDDPEPIFVAKYRLDPEVAEMIRSRVVPNDAPGHNEGVLLPGQPVVGPDGEPFLAPADSTGDQGVDAALAVRARQQAMFPAPVSAPLPEPDDGTRGGMLSIQAPSMDPESQIPFAQPALIPTPGDVVGSLGIVPNAPPGFTPMDMGKGALSIEAPAVAHVERPPRELSKAQIGAAVGVPPGIAAPGAAPAGNGQRSGVRVGASSKRPGDASDVEFKPTELAVDPAEEARLADAAMLAGLKGDVAQQEAADLAAIAAETATEQARMKADYEAMVLKHNTDADRMFQDIVAGKVNPDRVYANMGTGQRITTIIGLILGGMGKAAAGGDNPVLTALNREIDRDIGLQRDALDRKESAYRMFREQGKDDVEAWKLSKAAALDVAAAKMDAASKRYGGEEARLSAQQAVLKLRTDAAALRKEALGADYAKQLETFKTVQEAKSKAVQAKAQADGVRIDAFNANTDRMRAEREGMGAGGDKTLQVEIAPGQWIQAADPTAREKIAAARDGHDSFIKGLDQLEALRRKNPGGNVLPAWMAFMGFDSAEQSKVGDSLAGAVQLAFLKANGAGAYDKGSGALAQSIIESPASFFGTNDAAFFSKMAELKSLANADYMATIRGRMAPGQAPALFGSAPMNAKPIGRVP